MSGIGHNNGPTMERGGSWRRYAWKRSRAALLPKLPLEVVRLRVRRARELGLDYKTYAGVRAATGRDLVAFLYSSNALRVKAEGLSMAADRAGKLAALRDCGRIVLVQPPARAAEVLLANRDLIDAAGPAPGLTHGWAETRALVQAVLGTLPRDGVLVVGETALEREWSEVARLAGYLPAERFFTNTP